MTVLILLFALAMSLPFLVPHLGALALVGFVPLLLAEKAAEQRELRHFWRWHYPAFLLWNAATTFWIWNATAGGAIFAIAANALQMSLIFGLFRLSKKAFKGALPYIFLATLWIAWERAYFTVQISWPWLTLGNSMARTVSLAQWYEFSGTLGGSAWIWACNLAVFGLLNSLICGRWHRLPRRIRTSAIAGTAALLLVPMGVSMLMYRNFRPEEEGRLQVLIAQPNIDPYHKFSALTQDQQNAILEGQISPQLRSRTDSSSLLILAPETFTNDVITNDLQQSRTLRRFVRLLEGKPGVNMLFGASSQTFVESEVRPGPLSRQAGEGLWKFSHNSAVMTDGSSRAEIFHKSRLVVGVESTPLPSLFTKIDDALGGVMGRDVPQEEISLLHVQEADGTRIPIGCAICYESVYGEYCTGYVRKGAKAMTVITNDAWWGNTPGYRQHLSFASLRAIELRRDIARCANTGISAIISARGDILSRTPWWETCTLSGSIGLSSRETFFVRHGDICGRLCTFVAGLLMAMLLVALITGKRR